jgi:hypothetical protein
MAIVPWIGESLDEIHCEHYERIVANDNCVSFEGRILQNPSDRYRFIIFVQQSAFIGIRRDL